MPHSAVVPGMTWRRMSHTPSRVLVTMSSMVAPKNTGPVCATGTQVLRLQAVAHETAHQPLRKRKHRARHRQCQCRARPAPCRPSCSPAARRRVRKGQQQGRQQCTAHGQHRPVRQHSSRRPSHQAAPTDRVAQSAGTTAAAPAAWRPHPPTGRWRWGCPTEWTVHHW